MNDSLKEILTSDDFWNGLVIGIAFTVIIELLALLLVMLGYRLK